MAMRPCAEYPRCSALVMRGRCAACEAKHKPDAQRGSSTQRGYGYKWQQAREEWLKLHPLCVDPYREHERAGVVVAAQQVDHIVRHRKDFSRGGLFWNRNNWQSLCDTCHSRKTAGEDGGFGRGGRGG